MNKRLETIQHEVMNLMAEEPNATTLVIICNGNEKLFGANGVPSKIAATIAASMNENEEVAEIMKAAVFAYAVAPGLGAITKKQETTQEEKKE